MDQPTPPARLGNRAFGFTLAIVLTLIGLVVTLVLNDSAPKLFTIAGLFLFFALVKPAWLMPLNRLWQRFALRLGKFNNALILGVIFFLFITPIGLLLRLLRRDPMHRSFETGTDSYLTPVFRQTNEETCEDLF